MLSARYSCNTITAQVGEYALAVYVVKLRGFEAVLDLRVTASRLLTSFDIVRKGPGPGPLSTMGRPGQESANASGI